MAAASESDDASEIFWPGYVDAVTNLAINLLFVIAVMSIVVMTSILQISKMKPQPESAKPAQPAQTQESRGTPSQSTPSRNQSAQATGEITSPLAQAQIALEQAQAALQKSQPDKISASSASPRAPVSDTSEQLRQLQLQIGQLQKQLKASQAQSKSVVESGSARQSGTSTDVNQPAEVVQAQQRARTTPTGQNHVHDISAGGVVVVFGNDVIDLSESEVAELLRKLVAKSPIKDGRWQLRVMSPKGFSEATRMAYYRVNSLRNILLKHGAQAQDIEMRVFETENESANNARVLVRLMP